MRPLQYWLKPLIPPHAWHHGRVRVSQACVAALAPWKNPQWFKQGVMMGMVYRRKVVLTDASNTGWGALCKGNLTFGSWSIAEGLLQLNCLEMIVCWVLQTFLPDLKGRPRASPFRQHDGGGLYKSPWWAHLETPFRDGKAPLGLGTSQTTFIEGSTRAWHAEPESRHVPSDKWMLHPQTVQEILEIFGKAEVNLFASKYNSHYWTYF